MENATRPNIANYFILPLLGLNKFSFVEKNFVNAYVTHKEEIAIEVEDLDKVPQNIFKLASYLTDFEIDDKKFIFFRLKEDLQDTISKFVEGKYSEFSEPAKNQIRKYSGLLYKAKIQGRDLPYTADLLLVLDKDPELKAKMEENLGVKIEATAELREKPSATNILTY